MLMGLAALPICGPRAGRASVRSRRRCSSLRLRGPAGQLAGPGGDRRRDVELSSSILSGDHAQLELPQAGSETTVGRRIRGEVIRADSSLASPRPRWRSRFRAWWPRGSHERLWRAAAPQLLYRCSARRTRRVGRRIQPGQPCCGWRRGAAALPLGAIAPSARSWLPLGLILLPIVRARRAGPRRNRPQCRRRRCDVTRSPRLVHLHIGDWCAPA